MGQRAEHVQALRPVLGALGWGVARVRRQQRGERVAHLGRPLPRRDRWEPWPIGCARGSHPADYCTVSPQRPASLPDQENLVIVGRMDQPPLEDVIEIQQLLARYAVGMTKDDVEAVMEVFTPDGTYSAFGDTYSLADFPTLVAAAPKGLFMVGPPALELDGDDRHGRAAAVLRRPDQPRHAHRLVHRHLPAHRATAGGCAPGTMTFLRKSGARDSGRAHDPTRPAAAPGTLMELDEFRAALDGWLDEHEADLAPDHDGRRDARRADGPARQGQAARPSTPAGCGGAGRSGSAASAARPLLRAYLGEALTAARPGRARHLLDDRGAGADDDRLRAARARGDDGAAAAAGRRDVVPGLLRAGHRQQPRPRSSCRAVRDRRRLAGHRPEGVDEPRPVRPALRAAHPHRHAGVGAPRHHRAVRRHGHARASPCARSRRCTARPEFCEVFFDDVVVPFDRTLGDEGQGWSVAMDLLPYERSTALWHRAALLHRRLQQLLEPAPPGALDPAEVGEVTQLLYAFRARSRATQHRLAAGEHARARRRRSTRCCWRRRSRPCSTSSPTGSPPR